MIKAYKSSGLLRCYATPAILTEISNSRYRAYSRFLLSCQMAMHPCKQACSMHSRLTLDLYTKKVPVCGRD